MAEQGGPSFTPAFGDHIEPDYGWAARDNRDMHLSDEEYGRVLDTIVIATADAVLIRPDGRVLLGERAWDPAPVWWIIGGRMRPGEACAEAAYRNVARETGVRINPSRFTYLTTFHAVWAKRRQEPVDHGSATVSVTMTAHLRDSEAESVALNEEYRDMRWADPAELLEHPLSAMRQVGAAYRVKQVQIATAGQGMRLPIERLARLLIDEAEDQTIGQLAARYCESAERITDALDLAKVYYGEATTIPAVEWPPMRER